MHKAVILAAVMLPVLSFAAPLHSELNEIDAIAEAYVRLVLKAGLYDPLYVDAYYGPEEWRPADNRPASVAYPLERLAYQTDSLITRLQEFADSAPNKMRHGSLLALLTALRGTIDKLSGKKISFDEESMALYGAVAPHVDINVDSLKSQLDSLLPGSGGIPERLVSLRSLLIVPDTLVDTVFKTALHEVRRRTLEFLDLPAYESVAVELVTNQSWGGYNRYRGDGNSLISINLDQPFRVYNAVGLACHEGYPGHHVQGVLKDKCFVQDSGWVEYSIQPLYSPESIIDEGLANYADDVLFTDEERLAFEKSALYPLAGLDTSLADINFKVAQILKALGQTEISIARDYLDGKITRPEAVGRLVHDLLKDEGTADGLADFYDEFQSYIITYRLGEDLVQRFIEDLATARDIPSRRARYISILTSPCMPHDLASGSL